MSNLSEEEKKIVAYLRFYLNDTENEYFDKDFIISKKDLTVILNLIERQQKELDKKDKIIDLMAEKLEEKSRWATSYGWKEYFTKQVEGE